MSEYFRMCHNDSIRVHLSHFIEHMKIDLNSEKLEVLKGLPFSKFHRVSISSTVKEILILSHLS